MLPSPTKTMFAHISGRATIKSDLDNMIKMYMVYMISGLDRILFAVFHTVMSHIDPKYIFCKISYFSTGFNQKTSEHYFCKDQKYLIYCMFLT